MTTQLNVTRADPFDIDVSDFQPEPVVRPKTDAAKVRQVSEANNFPSRAAKPKAAAVESMPKPRQQRRHRTGRNVQFNIKATAETVERFYRLADTQKWVLGETLSRALDALDASLKAAKG